MNIKDIAKLAGVGISTVSRVLNNRPDVHPETRKLIQDIIEQNNYVPNDNAKQLKQDRSKIIAIIVKGHFNILFLYMIENLQKNIAKYDYAALVHYIEQDGDELEAARYIIGAKKPQGIIFLGANIISFEECFGQIKLPCLISTTSASVLPFKNLSSVSIDDFLAGYQAIDYLIKQGHRKICVLGVHNSFLGRLREQGARKRALEAGIRPEHIHSLHASFSVERSYQVVSESLSKKPPYTAMFAISDYMAIGAIKAIFDKGYVVPDDISVVGLDGIEMAQYYNPSITTFIQPIEVMAQESAEIMIDMIENNRKAVHKLFDLTIREGGSVKVNAER